MEKVREQVVSFYLSQLGITRSPKLAMLRTERKHGFKRPTVYKWVKQHRQNPVKKSSTP